MQRNLPPLVFTFCFVVWCTLLSIGARSTAAPANDITAKSRCPVCGMFVAKYPDWVTQIRHADGTVQVFDGVKDMLAYYFEPAQFGGPGRESVQEIWVKDYYTLEWLDARHAFYVIGSDTYGPMGHEFIPFSSPEAATNFRQDHHGEKVLAFDDISQALVEALRSGHKMKP
jgi:copper chaperone NosL